MLGAKVVFWRFGVEHLTGELPVDKAEHELTRGSPGSVPAGILTPKIHTWIRAGMFPRITWIRRSNTCGFAGTCHSAGWHRYLQVYPQVNIFFTV